MEAAAAESGVLQTLHHSVLPGKEMSETRGQITENEA